MCTQNIYGYEEKKILNLVIVVMHKWNKFKYTPSMFLWWIKHAANV